jgi:transcriptional regulator with XRE-family HTH domain
MFFMDSNVQRPAGHIAERLDMIRVVGVSDVPEPWATAMRRAHIGNPRNGVPSFRSLALKSNVAVQTIIDMLTGRTDPGTETLQAVADALRVDVRKVADWVGTSWAVAEPYEPPAQAHLLDQDERDAVSRIIRLLAASKGDQHVEGTTNEAGAAEDTPTKSQLHALHEADIAARPRKTGGRRTVNKGKPKQNDATPPTPED